ncbi:hypothetical protein [Streptomyces sp. NPDC055055]
MSGAPRGVVAWVDHDLSDGVLLLNARHFTAEEEEAITEALMEGRFTALQLLNACSTRGG